MVCYSFQSSGTDRPVRAGCREARQKPAFWSRWFGRLTVWISARSFSSRAVPTPCRRCERPTIDMAMAHFRGRNSWSLLMSPIPLHIQRRLAQRWASRFASIAPNASKEVGTKSSPSKPTVPRAVRQKPKKNPPGLSPAGPV
jgi:hypothetical protein